MVGVPRPERALGADDDELVRFAADLRKVKEQAGSPTLRELARRAHYSLTTLSEATSGRKLPTLEVTLAYVRACGGDAADWEDRWRKLAEGQQPQQPPDDPPYLGLEPFGTGDTERFRGRDRLVAELVSKVTGNRFAIMLGASGSGKTSLLHAGLVPALKMETVVLTPGGNPLEELSIQLARLAGTTAEELRADSRALHRLAHQLPGELLVVVDQFEELFTVCRDDDERAAFLALLTSATRATNSRCRVVLAVRADFHVHLVRRPELAEALRRGYVLVRPMQPDELRAAIAEPAIQAGCRVETTLLARVLADSIGQPGALPFVSQALLETWRRRRGTTLTLAGYEACGGIDTALTQAAEDTYARLSPGLRERARQILQRFVTPDVTTRRIKRAALTDLGEDAYEALETLIAARLLTVDHDTVEIAHDALIRSWPRLTGWLDEDREGQRLHHQLTEDVRAWEALERDRSAVYQGKRLAAARQWQRRTRSPLTTGEQEFLDAGARVRTRRRLFLVIGAMLAVVVITGGFLVAHLRRTAQEDRTLALSRELASRAGGIAATNPEAAQLLAVEGFHQAPTPEARSILLTLQASRFITRMTGDVPHGVAFSPDGHTIAVATTRPDAEGEVQLWDVPDRRQLSVLTGHMRAVSGVAFSPDGRTLAVGSQQDPLRLWDMTTHQEAAAFDGLAGVSSLAFSPDGRMLATGDAQGSVRLWDVAGHTEISAFEGHVAGVNGIAFSPDGSKLATAGADGTARLWEVAAQREIGVFAGHSGAVNGVAFSPDGTALATGGADGTARLWNVATHRDIATVGGHASRVLSVAFSPDGATLATTSDDRSVVLWDVSGSSAAPPAHVVAFTPDGHTAAIIGADRIVRLWDMVARRESAELGYAATAVSLNSDRLAVLLTDGTVRLLDIATRREITSFTMPAAVTTLAMSPDGHTLATVHNDHKLRLWDTDSHEAIVVAGAPTAQAFSADGKTLATCSGDGVRLWTAVGTFLARLAGSCVDVSFSPRGTDIAVAAGGDVTVWNIASLTPVTGFHDIGSAARTAFSPDGRMLAIGADNGTVALWTVPGGQPFARLTGTGAVRAIAFTVDGLAIADNDGTPRLWSVDPAVVAAKLCKTIRATIAPEQWAKILPDVPFQATC